MATTSSHRSETTANERCVSWNFAQTRTKWCGPVVNGHRSDMGPEMGAIGAVVAVVTLPAANSSDSFHSSCCSAFHPLNIAAKGAAGSGEKEQGNNGIDPCHHKVDPSAHVKLIECLRLHESRWSDKSLPLMPADPLSARVAPFTQDFWINRDGCETQVPCRY